MSRYTTTFLPTTFVKYLERLYSITNLVHDTLSKSFILLKTTLPFLCFYGCRYILIEWAENQCISNRLLNVYGREGLYYKPLLQNS